MSQKEFITGVTKDNLKNKRPSVFLIDGVGKLLIAGLVDEESEGVWLAVGIDGKALKILDANLPVDVFDLAANGFPLHIAEAVAELVVSLGNTPKLHNGSNEPN